MQVKFMDVLTGVTAVAALIVVSLSIWDRAKETPSDRLERAREDRYLDNWQPLATVGNRLGPDNAAVRIVTFEDYECPACRTFYHTLKAVMPSYANDVQVVHRHFPLTYHEHAYGAARAVECAAVQGKFADYHKALYEQLHQLGKWEVLAANVGIPDSAAFNQCVQKTTPEPSVERDLAAVNVIEARGTPAVIVNGLLLGGPPDSSKLVQLISTELRRRKGAAD